MSRFIPDPETLRLGEALAALRRDRGLSQAEAGARLNMTSQGWGLYEAGRRSGLFRPDVQRRLTGALGSTPEALAWRCRRRSRLRPTIRRPPSRPYPPSKAEAETSPAPRPRSVACRS